MKSLALLARARGARELLFDPHPPGGSVASGFRHRVALGLGGARDIADTSRIVQDQLQGRTARHLLEPHLGMGPVERALEAAQIEHRAVSRTIHLPSMLSKAAHRHAREFWAR
jgi:hypothetical protein